MPPPVHRAALHRGQRLPGLYRGLQLAEPSHRRELQTHVSTTTGLTSALANTAVSRIVLAPGTYYLSAQLSITRSVVLEAAVTGSVVLDAQGSFSGQRIVLNINPGLMGVVRLIGLNITGGYTSNQYGGGVSVTGGTVAISSCTISGGTQLLMEAVSMSRVAQWPSHCPPSVGTQLLMEAVSLFWGAC
jgi:hypothetical protein